MKAILIISALLIITGCAESSIEYANIEKSRATADTLTYVSICVDTTKHEYVINLN